MKPEQIAVIVVNWKVKDLLRECLVSLQEASGWPWGSYEVFMVDNDSGDGSVDMVSESFPGVHVIANTRNAGFGAANNQAFAQTRADVVVLLNPDTVVRPQALKAMVDSLLSEPDLGIVGCRLLNKNGSLQRWTAGAFPTLGNVVSHYLFLDRLLPSSLRPAPLYMDRDLTAPQDVGWVSGACMAIRREALRGMLFDERFFMYAEDMELCHRVTQQGWRVRYDPRMSIVHYQGASLQQQSADIMISSLKGPRDFFMRNHGPLATGVLDGVTVAGFALRWLINQVAASVKPAVYQQRAALSRRYLQLACQVMRLPRQAAQVRSPK